MKKRFTVIFISMLLAVSLLTACTSETTEKYVYEGSTVDDFKSASYGDSIYFGSYEQDNNLENGKEAIEWFVLSNEDNTLFLTTKYGVDCQPYNIAVDKVDVTWEECTLRKWLNDNFYNEAFSSEEKASIQLTHIANDDNLEMRTFGGNDTDDYVFCLSIEEARNMFKSDEDRKTFATEYAVSLGAASEERNGGTSRAWLRSPGNYNYRGALILGNGSVSAGGFCANGIVTVVKPVIIINY